jgi:hypothetical protein
MTWWIWLLVGFGLLAIEMATPGGLYFLFFGAGAIAVGIVAALGVTQDWLQLVIFSVLSVGSLLLFRGPLLRRLKPVGARPPVDQIAGQTATLTDDVPARGPGKAELRGTVWNVENAADQALTRGQRVRIERVEGLKLIVRPE